MSEDEPPLFVSWLVALIATPVGLVFAIIIFGHTADQLSTTNWDTTIWILTAIGDANFLDNDFQAGVDNLSNAMHCAGAIGNPFIHMRLGQCLFEIGSLDRAADELTRAYALEGDEIFSEDDPKYLKFRKTRIDTN